ncbi:MAG: flippase-like domain-containing protein [Methanosarcinaceae archaeon]|nr:flippase-like domain-containing protein [Methanosarcinaceae archaeon]
MFEKSNKKKKIKTTDQENTYKKLLKVLIWVIVLIFFVKLLQKTDIQSIFEVLKEIPSEIFLILFGLQILTMFLLNYQWYSISKAIGIKTDFLKMFYISSQGTVIESITPGAKIGGELTRSYLVNNCFKCRTADSLSIITIQKIISIGSLILLNLTVLLLFPETITDASPVCPAAIKALTVAMVVILTLFIILLFKPSLITGGIGKMNFKSGLFERLKNGLKDYETHVKKIRNKKTLLFQLCLSLVIWALFPLKLLILTKMFNPNISILGILFAALISYSISMIPITPGGLGVFETTLGGFLIIFGLSIEQSIATSITFRFFTFWLVIILSLVIIIFQKIYVRTANAANEIQKMRSGNRIVLEK